MKKYILYTCIAFMLIYLNYSCNSDTKQHKACFKVEVIKNDELVTMDSCFVAPTADSLEKLIAAFKQKRDAPK